MRPISAAQRRPHPAATFGELELSFGRALCDATRQTSGRRGMRSGHGSEFRLSAGRIESLEQDDRSCERAHDQDQQDPGRSLMPDDGEDRGQTRRPSRDEHEEVAQGRDVRDSCQQQNEGEHEERQRGLAASRRRHRCEPLSTRHTCCHANQDHRAPARPPRPHGLAAAGRPAGPIPTSQEFSEYLSAGAGQR